jgi:hypothetical protein
MDEKQFKRHLKDLVRGHHNVAEHDWSPAKGKASSKTAKAARRKRSK